jgi:hypothetical protein
MRESGDVQKKRASEIALCVRDWLARNPEVGTIKKLSIISGVPYSTLKKIVSAQRGPALPTVKKLVEHAGVESLRRFIEEPMVPSQEAAQSDAKNLIAPSLKNRLSVDSVPILTAPDTKCVSSSQLPKDATVRKDEAKELPDTREIEQKVRRIIGTFYLLKEQLEFLKEENEQGRDFFRKYLSKRDAAYVVALLQALFSEDEFQTWILFSEYRTGGTNP